MLYLFWPQCSPCRLVSCITTINIGSAVYSVAFSTDGNFLATGSDPVKIWRISSDGASATLISDIDHNGVLSVAFHPTKPLLATGSNDNTAKLWQYSPDGATVRCIATLEGHSYWVHSVAFHPTENILATGSRDKTAKVWRFSSDGVLPVSCVATLNNDEPIFSVAFHPTKNILAIGSSDITTKLLNFSPDDKKSSFTELETLNGHTGDVQSVVFSTDGAFLATASSDNTTILWRMQY